MQIYPYSTPIILTDAIFVENGGQTGTFTATQRQNAYRIAEQQATSFFGTFLLPTIVTGTFGASNRIVTDYGYVHQVYSVGILSQNNFQSCELQSKSGCVFVWQDTFGYLDVGCLFSFCGCSGYSIPYQIQVAYQAGLPTGVANQPAVLLGLTMAAQISLNEMTFPSLNEGTGDIGIEEFTSMDYKEKRVRLGRNAFGSSAKAAKIGQLLRSTVRLARPSLRL